MVKRMIESGADPRHIDPYGYTPFDKAKLYNRYELIAYFKEVGTQIEKGELKFEKDWTKFQRKGRYRTIFDY